MLVIHFSIISIITSFQIFLCYSTPLFIKFIMYKKINVLKHLWNCYIIIYLYFVILSLFFFYEAENKILSFISFLKKYVLNKCVLRNKFIKFPQLRQVIYLLVAKHFKSRIICQLVTNLPSLFIFQWCQKSKTLLEISAYSYYSS